MLCSRQTVPLSRYLPVVQALLNGVKSALTDEDGKFDRVLGAGASKEVLDVIIGCFNLNCKPPPGRKVGLHDEHHMCAS